MQQVGEIQSVGDGGFASPAVHSQFAAAAAVELPQPSMSEHASVGDAFGGGDVDVVRRLYTIDRMLTVNAPTLILCDLQHLVGSRHQ